jgi:glycosyltransferase involved in cell wall biosynthesis
MRILAMVFYFPPISGGGSVVPFEILNTIADLGHDVTVLTPNLEWKGGTYMPTMNSRLNVIRVETPLKNKIKLAARLCYFNLKKKGEEIGKKEKFDFIFTIFHPFHLVPNAAVSCSKALGIPVIVKVDDAIYAKSSGLKSIQRKIEKRFNSKSLAAATEVLVLNEDMKKLVSSFYTIPQENISIWPNGVNLSFFEVKNARKERKVVFSGVMYYHRGLEILLEAASKVVQNLPDTKFILLGEGPEMQRLQNIVLERNLTSNVEFKGWIKRDDIPAYLSEASVGIGPLQLTPLTAKSIPIKVLEYMASSLPIIAKKGILTDDLLKDGENGYFIEDANDLSKKITLLLENPDLVEKMGSVSRRMVQKFSWENLVNSILEKYKKI